MSDFRTKRLPKSRSAVAPDGSEVRTLLRLSGGSMAHFRFLPGETSQAVAHRTVEEIWYFLRGCGEIWRRQGSREEVVSARPGVCITLPAGTSFQFRSFGPGPLEAVGVTMPPWPESGDADRVPGKWNPTVLPKD
jgi:mannose-6-phosphate isomerase-like protein (cupin superfamily)